tara:strand:+ start:191 stop:400 length:210 start_codon:yes stop_codon:yes gene_type:complete
MSNGNVKLTSRPLNVERDIKQKNKLKRLMNKRGERLSDGKGTKRITNRIKRLKNRMSGKSRSFLDMTWK